MLEVDLYVRDRSEVFLMPPPPPFFCLFEILRLDYIKEVDYIAM